MRNAGGEGRHWQAPRPVMRRRRFANLLITVGLLGLVLALLNAFSIIPRDSASARRRMQAISRVWHKMRGR